MPNISVGPAATLVYQPQTSHDHVFIANNSSAVVYLGQVNVSAATGMPLYPSQIFDLPVVKTSIYAASSTGSVGSLSGTATASVAQGATGITVASGGASWTQGMLLQFNDGVRTEYVTVGAGSGPTNIVISATAFAHNNGVTFTQQLGGAGGVLTVTAGTS